MKRRPVDSKPNRTRQPAGNAARPTRKAPPPTGGAKRPTRRAAPPAGRKRMSKEEREKIAKELMETQREDEKKTSGKQSVLLDMGDTKISWWYPKTGDHLMDVMPYKSGTNDWAVNFVEDKLRYFLWLKVHRRIGPTQDIDVVCPGPYGKKCPICEHVAEMKSDGVEFDDYKHLNPKDRAIWHVVVQDTQKEIDKGVQLWNSPFFYSVDHLQEISKLPSRDGKETAYIAYGHYWEGKTVAFTIKNVSKEFPTYAGYRFVDRDYDMEEYIEDLLPLDEYVKVLSYEEISEIYYGAPYEGKDEPEEVDEDVPEDEVYEEEEPQEDEPEEKPKRKRQAKASEEDIVDYCPVNGVWGEDCDQLDDCEQCDQGIWEKCAAEQQRILNEAEAKPRRKR